MDELTTKLIEIYSPDIPEDDLDTLTSDGQDATGMDESSEYVKVALLDDGVDPEWDGLGKYISGQGWPAPSESVGERGPPPPFYSSGQMKHGNGMARLITMACPFVRIYVAKINSSDQNGAYHPTFDVTQAIEVRGPRRSIVVLLYISH
jgi:hypothetical protein